MAIPRIATAIPKHRYQLGEFSVTILGDIESSDGVNYRYVAGVTREGESRPVLYVSAEKPAEKMAEGALAMRVSMGEDSQLLGASDRWSDLETFSRDALKIVSKFLGLDDELPHQLM